MRCPVCRADVGAGPQCRRCRADLSLLFSLEDQRRKALEEARGALGRDSGLTMRSWAQQAHFLRADGESARLLAVASLLCGDFPVAWQLYSSHFRKDPTPLPQPG